MEDKYKLDAKKVTWPAGTTGASVREVEFQPDSSFDEVVGVEVYQNSDGGVTNGYFQIGVSDADKSYIELAHKNAVMTSSSVDQRGKTRNVNIPIRNGRALKIRTYWPAAGALVSDLEYEMVFVLKRTVTATV